MLGWIKRREMFVEAYDFGLCKTDSGGRFLYSSFENGEYFLTVKSEKIKIDETQMICKNFEGNFYPVRKELFKTLYDVNSEDINHKYTRKVNGVMCYDPAETDFDEAGNRIVYHSRQGKPFYFDGEFLIEIEQDLYLFKDALGLVYSISKDTARKIYIINE